MRAANAGGDARKDGGDRRVGRTWRLLREALGSLIAEKGYGSITVKDILDRADVGRSTFYTHFRDKDDLLLSGIREMLTPPAGAGAASVDPREGLLGFGLPVLERHARHRQLLRGRLGVRGSALAHEQLRRVLTERVADELKRLPDARRRASPVPDGLLAPFLASTFILVLHWWLETGARSEPKDADAVFRALAEPVLASLLPG